LVFISNLNIFNKPVLVNKNKLKYYGYLDKNKISITQTSNSNSFSIAIYLNSQNQSGSVNPKNKQSDAIFCSIESKANNQFIGKSRLNDKFDLPNGICAFSELKIPKKITESISILKLKQEFTNERLLDTLDISKAPVKIGDTWKIVTGFPNQPLEKTFTVKITSKYKKRSDDSIEEVVADLSYSEGIGFVLLYSSFTDNGTRATYERGHASFKIFLNPKTQKNLNLLEKTGDEKYISCNVTFSDNPDVGEFGSAFLVTGKSENAVFETGIMPPRGECSAEKVIK
jgi:hypothetical protein